MASLQLTGYKLLVRVEEIKAVPEMIGEADSVKSISEDIDLKNAASQYSKMQRPTLRAQI